MYKKYKVKKKNKTNIYIIFGILVFSLLIMSYGYSLWSDKLNIKGKANIKVVKQEENTMEVDIPPAYASVTPPASGFKLVSNEVVNGSLITTIETIDNNNYSQSGIFSFYYTNKTGYDCTDGKTEINITGSVDAIGSINPTITASLGNGGMGVFHTYIPITASKILVETKIDIAVKYTINGEVKSFHYYVVIKPKA